MTREDALEAIEGKRPLSVFFADEVFAMRLHRTSSGRADIRLPKNQGESWALIGDVERLPRGAYGVPVFDGSLQALIIAELARIADINSPRGLGFLLGIVVEREGVRYLLHDSTGIFGLAKPAISLPASATLHVVKAAAEPTKKKIGLQTDRILSVLRELGYDPRSLPRRRGDEGPKERVWRQVMGDVRMFPSRKAFDTAWEKRSRE